MVTEESPNHLRGSNIHEVICQVPVLPWYIKQGFRTYSVKPAQLTLVHYDVRKPREQIDLYDYITVNSGEPLTQQQLSSHLNPPSGRTIGLTSLIGLDRQEFGEGLYPTLACPQAHLPFIDLDLEGDRFPTAEIDLITKEVQKTEIPHGLILTSGSPHHYHFIGLHRLLTDGQLITFVGLCLSMRDGKKLLVDAKWVGHTLTPMKYMMERNLKFGIDWSAYDFQTRFATLRISQSSDKPNLSKVVEVF